MNTSGRKDQKRSSLFFNTEIYQDIYQIQLYQLISVYSIDVKYNNY